MLEELEYNLWEHILQRLVDYGHAFSPEIEMAALQGDEAMLLHGEAVNIDMALTTQLARGASSQSMSDSVSSMSCGGLGWLCGMKFAHWTSSCRWACLQSISCGVACTA